MTKARTVTAPKPSRQRVTMGIGSRSFAFFWALGGGFLWWLVVPFLTLLGGKQGINSRAEARLPIFLGLWLLLVLLGSAAAGEVSANRISGAAYGGLVWITAGIMSHALRKLTPERNQQFIRGIIFIGALQGLLSLVAVRLHASPLSLIALPLSRFLGDQAGGVGVWATSRLAYTDYFGGGVVRSSGMMATAAWSGGFACLVLILLLLGRKNLLAGGMSKLWWAVAVGLNLCSLTFSYSRFSWAILAVTVAVYLSYRALSVVQGGPLLAGLFWFCAGAVAFLLLPWQSFLLEQDSLRPGSSGTRFTSYGEGFDAATGEGLLTFLAGNGAKPYLEELGRGAGSESTYVSLLVRGGVVAVVLFVAFIMARLASTYRARDWAGFALVAALAVHGVVEDLDVGTLTLLLALIEPARAALSTSSNEFAGRMP